MTASGGRTAASGQRLLSRRRRLDLVAGAAQARLQRAQDLRLVVDDEDVSGSCMPWKREDEMPAAAVLGPDARAVRLGEAARDREPEPGAARRAVAALERLEHAPRGPRARPGPVVVDVDEQLVSRPRRSDADASFRRRELEALSSRLTSARSICAASTCTGGASASSSVTTRSCSARAPRARARRDRRPSRAPGRLGDAASEAREVEQVADDAVEPLGLGADRGHELVAIGRVEQVHVADCRGPTRRRRSP